MRTFLLFYVLFPFCLTAQTEMERNLDGAYQNAKKGICWALTNIPDSKSRLKSDLISDEKLYSSVSLEKEYNGIRIESRGYFDSIEVLIIIYRSNEGLIQEGYLKKPAEVETPKE